MILSKKQSNVADNTEIENLLSEKLKLLESISMPDGSVMIENAAKTKKRLIPVSLRRALAAAACLMLIVIAFPLLLPKINPTSSMGLAAQMKDESFFQSLYTLNDVFDMSDYVAVGTLVSMKEQTGDDGRNYIVIEVNVEDTIKGKISKIATVKLLDTSDSFSLNDCTLENFLENGARYMFITLPQEQTGTVLNIFQAIKVNNDGSLIQQYKAELPSLFTSNPALLIDSQMTLEGLIDAFRQRLCD